MKCTATAAEVDDTASQKIDGASGVVSEAQQVAAAQKANLVCAQKMHRVLPCNYELDTRILYTRIYA